VRVREMTSSPWSADRSRARAGTEWTGVQMPSKYAGHLPRMQSNAISAILYVMRFGTGSQCSTSRSVGVMCWLRRMPVMSRAAAFCAASRRRMTTSATPYSAACIQWSKWLVTKAWAIRFKLFNCSNCSTVPVQCVVFGHKYTNVTDIARQN